jgi:hypothetical protein
VREPFISGADHILDVLSGHIPNATEAFCLPDILSYPTDRQSAMVFSTRHKEFRVADKWRSTIF